MSPRPRRGAGRYAAPVAFLLGITVAALLVRAGLDAPGQTTGSVPKPSTAQVRPKAPTVTTVHTPATETAVAGARYYTVQSGDTFGSIAAREGTTVEELMALNPGVSSNALQVGEQIRVE